MLSEDLDVWAVEVDHVLALQISRLALNTAPRGTQFYPPPPAPMDPPMEI